MVDASLRITMFILSISYLVVVRLADWASSSGIRSTATCLRLLPTPCNGVSRFQADRYYPELL
jgi:hypothetical protein